MSFAVSASLDALCRVKGKFDVVFVYQLSPITLAIPALVVKRMGKTPIVMWIQDLWPESVIDAGNARLKSVRSVLNALVQMIYDRTDYLLLSSQGFRQSIRSFGVPDNKMSYMPNWAEDFYEPCSREDSFCHDDLIPDGFTTSLSPEGA